ncbi:MAG: hypothetical protein V2B18_20090 [Pseudomonadota bacterium]
MIHLQVLALTLLPLLSGGLPGNGTADLAPLVMVGIESPITKDFMVGTWRYTEDFVRWGITDKKKATVSRYQGTASMVLHGDGSMRMNNLFRPTSGRWEVKNDGIVLFDPERPEWGTQRLQIRKRDENSVWVLLPFSGGATGIGLVRVVEPEPRIASKRKER